MTEIKRIFLDAGHGPNNAPGKLYDPGATIGPYKEHEIVASICSALEFVHRNSNDLHVMVVPEDTRSRIVAFLNGLYAPGDVLVSLHMNSSTNAKARGVECIVASNAPLVRQAQGKLLASVVAEQLRIPLRDVPVVLDTETPAGKGAGLKLLRDTRCPAFLLELGFISNPQDRQAVLSRGICAVGEGLRALIAEAKGND